MRYLVRTFYPGASYSDNEPDSDPRQFLDAEEGRECTDSRVMVGVGFCL